MVDKNGNQESPWSTPQGLQLESQDKDVCWRIVKNAYKFSKHQESASFFSSLESSMPGNIDVFWPDKGQGVKGAMPSKKNIQVVKVPVQGVRVWVRMSKPQHRYRRFKVPFPLTQKHLVLKNSMLRRLCSTQELEQHFSVETKWNEGANAVEETVALGQVLASPSSCKNLLELSTLLHPHL